MFYEKIFIFITDTFYSLLPQKKPNLEKLAQCKIISHRGEHDNKTLFENTIPAFTKIFDAGIWGIEFDVRWTKDLIPIVFHDENLQRLFHHKTRIADIKFFELRQQFPLIPSLTEVVDQFAGKLHLMIEVKQEHYPNPTVQIERLQKIFAIMTPIKDFHILSIHPEMFEYFKFLPSQALLPVVVVRYKEKSRKSVV